MRNTTTSTAPELMAIDPAGCRFNSDTPQYLYEPYGQTIRTWEDTGAGTSNSKYTEDGTANVPISDYNPFGYVSGYTEPDSGLIKFGTRYYAPKLATWTQADPESGSLENPLTLSPQGYALNDPCNKTDATGRSVVGCLFSSVGVVGGAFYIYPPRVRDLVLEHAQFSD